MTELTIACFYWNDPARSEVRTHRPFLPNDVLIWKSMFERNLTIPHRLVCITHLPHLFENIIETVPLDDRTHVPSTCLVKLMAHRPDITPALGERIFLSDLDVVVTGNLDKMLGRTEDAVFYKNPNYEEGGRRGFIQGSFQLFNAGARSQLWEDFDPNTTPGWLNRRFGGAEQAWISERLNTSYPEPGWEWNEAIWTEADGVYGAGRLFDGKPDKGVTSELPENAVLVTIPGNRLPTDPETLKAHPWIAKYYKVM